MNVYERTQRRLKTVFDLFDNIYVSFSGGKDSGVLLNLCIDYVRRHGLQRRIGNDFYCIMIGKNRNIGVGFYRF